MLSQDIRSFFSVAKKPSAPSTTTSPSSTSNGKQTKKKAVIVSSDEDEIPSSISKNKKSKTNSPVHSKKRRIVSSDDDDDNHTPHRKKPNLSKTAKPTKDPPKLKLVEDVGDMFGDAPVKRVDKPKQPPAVSEAKKTMTAEEVNSLFEDDLDVSMVAYDVPDVVDVSENKANGRANEDKVEPMDDSVVECTPKAQKRKERTDKSKSSSKKASLDSSNVGWCFACGFIKLESHFQVF